MLSFRDRCAVAAMQGFTASNCETVLPDKDVIPAIATAAYKIADAMLEARKT